MPLSKDLNAYAVQELLILEEALISPVELDFPKKEQLTAQRHRFYALRKLILGLAAKREKLHKDNWTTNMKHPIVDRAVQIETLTTAIKNNLTLVIGVHVFSATAQNQHNILAEALKNRGVNPNSYLQYHNKRENSRQETNRQLIELEQGLMRGDEEAVNALNTAQDIVKQIKGEKIEVSKKPVTPSTKQKDLVLKDFEIKKDLEYIQEYPDGARLRSDGLVELPTGQIIFPAIYEQHKLLLSSQPRGEEILQEKIKQLFPDKDGD